MKNTLRWLFACALLASLCACVPPAQAHDSDYSADHSDRQVVSVGHDSELPAGESAESVVAVMGNSKVDGDVSDSAVAVLGNVTVNGSTGDSAVAVLGNAYINGRITQDVVAVLGNVYLGPQAVIDGQVTAVMGRVERSSGSVIQGGTVNVMSGVFGDVEGLHAWIHDCLLFGRPLAPNFGVSWAWWLALATLGFYVLIAAIFQDGVRRCVHTLETHPGPSLLATVLSVLLLPVVLLALVITVVGIAVIPLLCIALFCAGIFGRIVAVGWVGGRCLRFNNTAGTSRPLLEVLVGGIVVLALYMVPVLGFLLYLLLGVFGFGAVIYTILLATRASKHAPAAPRPGSGGAPPAGMAGAGAPAGQPHGVEQPATMSGPATPPSWTATGAASTTAETYTEGGSTAGPPPPPPPPPGGMGGNMNHVLDIAALPRAGFWIRMLALLIDLILIGVALSWIWGHHGNGMLLVLATYGAIMWKVKGTTVGGIVCDLKVVRIGGGPLDWGTAIIRALGCFLSLVVAGLGFIWIAVDHEHQAWHDKIAGTVVVRVPKGVGLI
jgi:uncharacterized RDD family membrane protein YckC